MMSSIFSIFSSFRVVETTYGNKTFYTAQRKILFFWRNISNFYFSEFGEFPIINGSNFATQAEAENCISQFIEYTKAHKHKKVVYEERPLY